MIVEVKVPSPGESISEVEIGAWLVEDGSVVVKDQEIAEIESDKATLSVVAIEAGKIVFKASEGDTVDVGTVICSIDTDFAPQSKQQSETADQKTTIREGVEMQVEKEAPVEEVKDVQEQSKGDEPKVKSKTDGVKFTPVARELMKQHDISPEEVISRLARIGKKEVEAALSAPSGFSESKVKK